MDIHSTICAKENRINMMFSPVKQFSHAQATIEGGANGAEELADLEKRANQFGSQADVSHKDLSWKWSMGRMFKSLDPPGRKETGS